MSHLSYSVFKSDTLGFIFLKDFICILMCLSCVYVNDISMCIYIYMELGKTKC